MVTNGQFEGIREKEIFESDLSTLSQEANQLRADYLRYYLLFEEDESVDVLTPMLNFLDDSDSHLDKYVQAALLQRKGDFNGANNILTLCLKTSPQKEFYEVLEIMLASKMSGNYPTVTAAQLAELQLLATDENTPGATQARAIIRRLTDTEYPMNINTEVVNLRTLRTKVDRIQKALFQMQPNPANNSVWIQFPYEPDMQSAELNIVDLAGKTIFNQNITASHGLFELDSSSFTNGIYMLRLSIDNIPYGSDKLTIQH